jgi:hypothetical protein
MLPHGFAWWQVDLGGKKKINQIIIYNRTDCCANRLSNYQVSISDKADFNHQCCHLLHSQQQRGCGVDIYWIVWQVFQESRWLNYDMG